MTPTNRPLHHLIVILAWTVSTLVVVLPPTTYFLVARQGLNNALESQADLTSSAVKDIILSNPKTWRFEEIRLSELLERRPHDGVLQSLQIFDATGKLIASNTTRVAAPAGTYRRNIHDAGVVAGRIEVSRSLRPMLLRTAMVAFCSILIGAAIFFISRWLPLRIINKAFQALEESETKYRSLYESMREGMALHQMSLDRDGSASLTIIDANPSCAAMFGGDLDKVIGSSSFDLFGETFRESISELLKAVGRNDSTSFELRLPGTENYYNVQTFFPSQGLIATLFEDITESRISKLQIKKMAYFDILTGLPNRTLFYDRLNQAIALANRDDDNPAVLFIDLDHFKNINDTLGHSAGDQLLVEVAHRLAPHLRSNDTLARLGGDEFVVLITRLGKKLDTTYIAQKLIDSMREPFHIAGHELHITISIGIALFPDDGTNADTLIKHADMAMYFSKESGRNDYNFFSPVMNQKALLRMENEGGLRHALERNEFFLEFQPIMCAKTRTIVAAEALVRWSHPTRGRIPPDEFIPLAEDLGLIIPLGEWVIDTVCRTMKSWNDAGLPPIRYCVNVSSRQIERQNLPETVRTILKKTGANPVQLEIELTESCLVKNFFKNIADVFRMKEWGLTISIDDFGTGYSSLSYIRTLPIDHIKIDRSFVTDINSNVQNQAIVGAIIAMSQKLGIQNIAEGVETHEQLEFLQGQGCSEIQGYFFHRPLSLKDFEMLLRSQGRYQHRSR